jgi:hypothetical protein
MIPGPPGNATHAEEQDEDGGKEQNHYNKQDKDHHTKRRGKTV